MVRPDERAVVAVPPGPPPLVRVRRVVKRFTGVTAVDEVSFDVHRGEAFALLGPNGAGKSTLVRMLCGILLPDEGRITYAIDGEERPRVDPRRIGYLPEDRGLYPDAPVLRTITYLGTLRGLTRDDAAARGERWLARFGLSDRADSRIDSLSKGNQQKVQFIATVVHDPAVAILDEPFSGFDPVNQDLVVQLIRELRTEGMTVILSAHHMDLVEVTADRILLLHQGREILEGTLGQIRAATSAGRNVRVTFDVAPDLAAARAATGAIAVEPGAPGVLVFEIATGEAVGALLRALTELATVTDVTTAEVSLRDLYLRAVDDAGEREESAMAGAGHP